MHPSLRAKYRLRSDADVAIAERMMAAARSGGWTEAQIDGILEFYGGEVLPKLEIGRIDAAAAVTALWDWAGAKGIGDRQRGALLNWHQATDEYLEQHGGELPPLAAPAAQDAGRERAEIERIMREDPQRYWREEALQHRYYELIEGGGVQSTVSPLRGNESRQREIEALMYRPDGGPNPAYWNDAGVQAEYRGLLGGGDAAGVTAAIAAPAAIEGQTS